MGPVPFSAVEDGATVVRFVLLADAYIPPGARLPTRKAFEPSTDDKEEAAELKRPIAITVWNRKHTTISEARALMASSKPRSPFGLRVGDVHAVGLVKNEQRLRVIASPLTSLEPGSKGHCGVEGCDKPSGRPKLEHNAMLDELAGKTFPIDEEYLKNLEKVLKAYRVLAKKCAQCGGEPAYHGAIYCGAGCTARSEAHEPVGFKDMETR